MRPAIMSAREKTMDKQLKWGILATGWIAELFTQDLIDAGLAVHAVGSRSVKKASAFAERFAIPVAYGSYEELVADADVDVIYIATPHPYHVSAALLAIEAGKHVLIEKPFTLNAAEAQRIVSSAQQHNVTVLEAMWTRFLPHMRRIHAIMEAGTLGELRSLRAEHRQFLPTDPNHRLNALELGGGALLDLGIYPISFACDILGVPSSISATARFKETGVDAEVATIMTHAGGAVSTTVSALDIFMPNTAAIFGSAARIEIDATWYTPTSFRVVDHKGNILETFEEQVSGRGMQFQAIEMERLIQSSQQSTLMSPKESVAIIAVLDQVRQQIGLRYPHEK